MSGKRSASEAPADEPDAKAAKVEEEPKPEDADAEAADQDMAEEEGDKGDAAPARRSMRARNPVRKARIEGKTSKGVEAKIAQVQYKEGELLSDHLKSEGTLVEVKIPAECTVSTNLQVRTRQLWGTDVYTSDSDLVAVLMHTGHYLPSMTIPPSLLEVRAVVRAVPPEESYASTSRNGIRSRSWGTVRQGHSYKVESCRAVTVNGATIDLEAGANRVSPVAPTFFPNVVESVVNTRASAANSERRQRLIREVTVQYNLCNEPWLKYNVAAVADQGFKKSQWTAARLRRESLYLETHGQRYELSFEGDAEAVDDKGEGLAGEDKYRWARCLKPKPLAEMRRLGVPLPREELETVKSGLKWEDVKFGAGSVSIAGEEVNVVRLHFLSRT